MMSVIMVVHMNIRDSGWIEPYYAGVPAILSDYGAVSVAGARGGIWQVEGEVDAPPDRIAIFTFPSLEAVERFLADERYQPFRRLREAGAKSEIFVFENAVTNGDLV